jgi:hypothetical protein
LWYLHPAGTLIAGLAETPHHPAPKRRFSPALWIVPAALIVLGAVLFFVLRGGSSGGVPGPDNTIPGFNFRLANAIAIPVSRERSEKLQTKASEAAGSVTKTMSMLYTEAFLDPGNWRDGSYDSVWPMFDQASQPAAQQDESTLTLGGTAGQTIDTVSDPTGRLVVKVLFDRRNEPVTAVAVVEFKTLAKGKDGTYTEVVSTGQYFLRPAGGTWHVISFKVSRADHATVPSPGPSTSTTAAS